MSWLRSKSTRRIVILGLSLAIISAAVWQINQKTFLTDKARQMAGEVAGIFLANKFKAPTILVTETSAQVTSPYTSVDGNVSISGLVGIGTGTAVPGSLLDVRYRDNSVNLYRASDSTGQYRWRVDQLFNMVMTNSAGVDTLVIKTDGSVGIGTANPSKLLEVAASDGTEATNVRLSNTAWNANQLNTLEFYSGVPTSTNLVTSAIKSRLYPGGTKGELQFWTNSGGLNQRMTIDGDGLVGIGTASPGSKLEINESTDSKPGGVVVATKSVLKLSRAGTPNYSYNEAAEFRIGHGGPSYWGSKVDLYVNGPSNQNSIPDQPVMTWNYDGSVDAGDIRSDAPTTSGWGGTYLGLFTGYGSLPGYPSGTYATLKTDGAYIGFSAAGKYSAYMDENGVWTGSSSRDLKENFVQLDPQEILTKIDQLPMYQWNFKNENPSIKHIAPVAQDFYSAFGLNGDNDKMISNIDPSGVALVGVKALSAKIKEQQKQITPLLDIVDIVNKIGHFTQIIADRIQAGLIETQKLIVGGVDILEKITSLQAENAALRSKVDSLELRLKALEEKTR